MQNPILSGIHQDNGIQYTQTGQKICVNGYIPISIHKRVNMRNAYALILSADTVEGFILACTILNEHDSVIVHANTYEKVSLVKIKLLEKYPWANIHTFYAALDCLQEVYWMISLITDAFDKIECIVLSCNYLEKKSFARNDIECHHIANILTPYMCVMLLKDLLVKSDSPKVILMSARKVHSLLTLDRNHSQASKKNFAASNQKLPMLAQCFLQALTKECPVDVYHCKFSTLFCNNLWLLDKQQASWRSKITTLVQKWINYKNAQLFEKLLTRNDKAAQVYEVIVGFRAAFNKRLQLKIAKRVDSDTLASFMQEMQFDTRL